MVAFDFLMFVFAHLFELIADDDQVAVMANPFLAVVFSAVVVVFFGVDEELFFAFFVFETQFVESFSAFAAVRLTCRDALMPWAHGCAGTAIVPFVLSSGSLYGGRLVPW